MQGYQLLDTRWFLDLQNKKTRLIKFSLSIPIVLVLFVTGAYAMQPPPPPLNLTQLKHLITLADVIVAGRIATVKETQTVYEGKRAQTVEAVLNVEKVLKGKVTSDSIIIKETYSVLNPPRTAVSPKQKGEPKKTIIGLTARPSRYHGEYAQGVQVLVLLERIAGCREYKPLGSGTYDEYLCEFVIGKGGVQTRYFKFAEDLKKYTGSEAQFIALIERLRDSGAVEGE